MTPKTMIGAALAGLMLTAAPALANNYGYGHGYGGAYSGFGSSKADARYIGKYKPVPGCCANAPYPREQLNTKRYIYPNGTQVIVYPGDGAGYQEFWWQQN